MGDASWPGLRPCRGLVTLHNHKGQYLLPATLKRWILLHKYFFKLPKLDLLDWGGNRDYLNEAARFAEREGLHVSLRTTPEALVRTPELLSGATWMDVVLCVSGEDTGCLPPALEIVKSSGLPLRIQVELTATAPPMIDALREGLDLQAPVVVHLYIQDPFPPHRAGAQAYTHEISHVDTYVKACQLLKITIIGVCFDEEWAPPTWVGLCEDEFFRNGSNFDVNAWRFAYRQYRQNLLFADLLPYLLLAKTTSRISRIDNFLLRLTLDKNESILQFAATVHRLFRMHRWWPRSARVRMASAYHSAEHLLISTIGFRDVFPGAQERVHNPEGELPAPYLDAIDAARLKQLEAQTPLAEAALRRIHNDPPDRVWQEDEYGSENAHTKALPGSVRWFSVANVEKRSTLIDTFSLPFTLQATFGGNSAEYVGFAVGREGRIVYSSYGFNDTLTLHADAAGNYVLLCGNEIVEPMEMAGPCYLPTVLPDRAPLQLVMGNIDKTMLTQGVQAWYGETAPAEAAAEAEISIVIVTHRYARRLDATLRGIATQQGYPPEKIEVLVAFVPGADSTEDVIDTMRLAWPDLRIVKVPYSDRDARAKGKLINETVTLAQGEWVLLLDSDIVLPPHALATSEAQFESANFIAPRGRKMLGREDTARILAGTVDPAQIWPDLLEGPGETRTDEANGLPIGYFQLLKRTCFDTVQYVEYGHFEGADWRFAEAIQAVYGPVTRLENLTVLHLDHGGSHWFGSEKHW